MKTQTIKLEIRAAEGGEDAKLLVKEMSDIYKKSATVNNFTHKVEHWTPGYVSIWLTGNGVRKFFENEIGGHRWQRIPPTEKRGRVQTSTVTVAVMDQNTNQKITIDKNDVERENVVREIIDIYRANDIPYSYQEFEKEEKGSDINNVFLNMSSTKKKTCIMMKVMKL